MPPPKRLKPVRPRNRNKMQEPTVTNPQPTHTVKAGFAQLNLGDTSKGPINAPDINNSRLTFAESIKEWAEDHMAMKKILRDNPELETNIEGHKNNPISSDAASVPSIRMFDGEKGDLDRFLADLEDRFELQPGRYSNESAKIPCSIAHVHPHVRYCTRCCHEAARKGCDLFDSVTSWGSFYWLLKIHYGDVAKYGPPRCEECNLTFTNDADADLHMETQPDHYVYSSIESIDGLDDWSFSPNPPMSVKGYIRVSRESLWAVRGKLSQNHTKRPSLCLGEQTRKRLSR